MVVEPDNVVTVVEPEPIPTRLYFATRSLLASAFSKRIEELLLATTKLKILPDPALTSIVNWPNT